MSSKDQSCAQTYEVGLDNAHGSFVDFSFNVNSSMVTENDGNSVDDDELCPVECVREFKLMRNSQISGERKGIRIFGGRLLLNFLQKLRVYREGIIQIVQGTRKPRDPVIFLKLNVLHEYDEQSKAAERLRIESVPLFHFDKHGRLLEAFPTRNNERILAVILKYSSEDARS